MPLEEHESFLDDYINIVTSMQLTQPNLKQNDCQFLSPYKLIIAYARK